MNWAEITILILMSISLFVAADKHGEERGKYSFWATLISTAITIFLFISAGLFI